MGGFKHIYKETLVDVRLWAATTWSWLKERPVPRSHDLMVMLSKVEANNLVHYGNQNQTGKKSYFPSLVDKYYAPIILFTANKL